ncbi:MAG: 4Fe-4S dicluster domain-containing protein [Elusimicrobiota bacterium]|jgi:Na+-translocating ferredoxin:NAD+ oxidoreductase RnfC subunit
MSDFSREFARRIRRAGVVGAGGAGFPSYVKASGAADTAVVNGAECEPLLQKDQELLARHGDEVLTGLELLMRAVGAKAGIVAVKEKHAALVAKLEAAVKGRPGISVKRLGDFYPAGDEFTLVHEATGRLIPPGGLPGQVGVVVNNVETLYNMARADRSPVTDTFLTVTGAVKKPCTLRLPVGTAMSEALALAGGPTVRDPAVLDGGAMMGRVETDFSKPLTKTSAGLIVLPAAHPLVRRKGAPRSTDDRVGKSACDQCSLCTELCPRYLLGYDVQPHRVMRGLLFSRGDRKTWNPWALLCCECQLCTLYSCPEGLAPGKVCGSAKRDLAEQKVAWKGSALDAGRPVRRHSMYAFRKTPVSQLMKRLGLCDYKADAPLLETPFEPASVRILLKQHVGVPAVPTVKVGDRVERGAVIGEVPEEKLGVPVHASVSGVVGVVGDYVEIRRSA